MYLFLIYFDSIYEVLHLQLQWGLCPAKQSLNLRDSFVKRLQFVFLGHNLTLQAVGGYDCWIVG